MRYRNVYVHSLAYELAPVVVSSEELEERLEPVYRKLRMPFGQLEQWTGIDERRWWPSGAKVSTGAADAAAKLLDRGALEAGEIEALVFCGVCRDEFEPATACHVAAALQERGHSIAASASVHDLSNACLGVLNAVLDLANRVELGQIRAGLVVSAESAREIVETAIEDLLADPTAERYAATVATLTGGSGAVALLVTDGSVDDPDAQLLGAVHQTAPEHHELCRWGVVPAGERPATSGSDPGARLFRQRMRTDAAAVLQHGVVLGRRTWERFLRELDWTAESVDRTVCHQVGERHRREILASLGLASERDFAAYGHLGNTGTVALPLALALAAERGFVAAGDRVGLLGIGSGLNCLMAGCRWLAS